MGIHCHHLYLSVPISWPNLTPPASKPAENSRAIQRCHSPCIYMAIQHHSLPAPNHAVPGIKANQNSWGSFYVLQDLRCYSVALSGSQGLHCQEISPAPHQGEPSFPAPLHVPSIFGGRQEMSNEWPYSQGELHYQSFSPRKGI